jgi:hypothetical protein
MTRPRMAGSAALRDMTRPRMDGSARSCRVALLVATKEMLAAPIGTSRTMTPLRRREAAARIATPKVTPMAASRRVDGRLRKAVTRPPNTASPPMAARSQL